MKISFTVSNRYAARSALASHRSDHSALLSRSLWDPELGVRSIHQALELAALADDSGFDFVSVSEHHYAPTMVTPNPALTAAALSQVVRRAGIALLGPLASINNPVRIAEEFAMLDQLTDGRLIALPLRGLPDEFTYYNVDAAETKERTQEAALLIKKALSEPDPFSWRGRFFDFPIVSVWPGPTQIPHMPLYFSANSPDSIEFAAEHQFGAACSFFGPEDVALRMARYRELAARHGWTPTPDQMLYRASCVCGRNEAEADGLIERFEGAAPKDLSEAKWLPQSMRNAGLGFGFLQFKGDAAAVFEQLRDFHELTGVGIIDLNFGSVPFSHEETMAQVHTFASHVLPRIKSLALQVAKRA